MKPSANAQGRLKIIGIFSWKSLFNPFQTRWESLAHLRLRFFLANARLKSVKRPISIRPYGNSSHDSFPQRFMRQSRKFEVWFTSIFLMRGCKSGWRWVMTTFLVISIAEITWSFEKRVNDYYDTHWHRQNQSRDMVHVTLIVFSPLKKYTRTLQLDQTRLLTLFESYIFGYF